LIDPTTVSAVLSGKGAQVGLRALEVLAEIEQAGPERGAVRHRVDACHVRKTLQRAHEDGELEVRLRHARRVRADAGASQNRLPFEQFACARSAVPGAALGAIGFELEQITVERMVEPGDWTGPAGARQILVRRDIDAAVLETARGGIVLRGIGYESNEASVLTNVSSDHLDLQGIHTLPELAEVKSTICRITKPSGWVVLNADDALVAAVARRVKAHVALFTLEGDASRGVRSHRARGGRAYLVRNGVIVEANGEKETRIVDVAEVPITIGGLARHNVANALAAAGGARGLGATIAQVRAMSSKYHRPISLF